MSCKQEKLFRSFFPNGTFFKPALDEIIFSEKIESSRIRSALWKFYLIIFPRIDSTANVSEWSEIIKAKRLLFQEYKKQFIINIVDIKDQGSLGPLSNDPKWDQYFKDEEQMNVIITDTNRLYQEYAFFHDSENIRHINEIVFLHLKTTQDEYKQGFHELCGTLYYIYKQEMKSICKDFQSDIENNFGYNFLFSKNQDDIDSDVFWTYKTLIEYVKPFYMQNSNPQKPPFVVETSEYILSDLLRKYDRELSEKIYVGDTFASIIPWTRLFFSRQFCLDDLPSLWSIIFSFFPNFDIVCYVSVAILITYREKLLACVDETAILVAMMNLTVDHEHSKEVAQLALQLYGEANSTPTVQSNISKMAELSCREIQKVMNNIQAVQKVTLISELKKFRDSLNLILKSDKNDFSDFSSSDMEQLQSLPPSELEHKSSPDNLDIPLELSPLTFTQKDDDK